MARNPIDRPCAFVCAHSSQPHREDGPDAIWGRALTVLLKKPKKQQIFLYPTKNRNRAFHALRSILEVVVVGHWHPKEDPQAPRMDPRTLC